ncbi:hypothetical protein Tco_0640425 [Tanacetum coccineum]
MFPPSFVGLKERVYNSEDESSHAAPHLNEVESDNDNGTDDEEKQNLGDNREPSPSLSHPPGFSMNRDTATNIEVSDVRISSLKWVWAIIFLKMDLFGFGIRALYMSDSINPHRFMYVQLDSILRELHVLKDKGFDFWSHCKRRIGNGSDTRFWFDCWIGETSFHTLFPRLVALEEEKNISVALKLNSSLDQSFRRCVRDGIESQQIRSKVYAKHGYPHSNSRDRWRF